MGDEYMGRWEDGEKEVDRDGEWEEGWMRGDGGWIDGDRGMDR